PFASSRHRPLSPPRVPASPLLPFPHRVLQCAARTPRINARFDKPVKSCVTIIGGGLAGSEAVWQAAIRGASVLLYEMRPVRPTPAHQTSNLAEIVCSNSLKSDEPGTAPYLLKEELRRAGSLLIQIAHEYSVPAGAALAVDRERFSEAVTARLSSHP